MAFETPPPITAPLSYWIAAYHEAGHVVIGHRLGLKFDWIEMRSIDYLNQEVTAHGHGALGEIIRSGKMFEDIKVSESGPRLIRLMTDEVWREMQKSYAGPIAEAAFEQERINNNSYEDLLNKGDECLKDQAILEEDGSVASESDYGHLIDFEASIKRIIAWAKTRLPNAVVDPIAAQFDFDKLPQIVTDMVIEDWLAISFLAYALVKLRSESDENVVKISYEKVIALIENSNGRVRWKGEPVVMG